MNNLVNEVAELRKAVTAPDSIINKRFETLQVQVEKQGEIIARHQRYLEAIDRKERDTNLVIIGVPDEDEALEGATSEQDKLSKIWTEEDVRETGGWGPGVTNTDVVLYWSRLTVRRPGTRC